MGPTACAPLWSFHVGADGGGVQGMECAPAVSAAGVVVAPLNVGGAGALYALSLATGATGRTKVIRIEGAPESTLARLAALTGADQA